MKCGSANDVGECFQPVMTCSALDGYHKKFVFISADEISVKTAQRYSGGHV